MNHWMITPPSNAPHWAVYDWGADQPMAFLRYTVVLEYNGVIRPCGGEPMPHARRCTRLQGELAMAEAHALADRLEAERPPAPDGTPVRTAPRNPDGTIARRPGVYPRLGRGLVPTAGPVHERFAS